MIWHSGGRHRMSFAEHLSFCQRRNWQGIKCLRRDVFRTRTFSVPFQRKTQRNCAITATFSADWQERKCACGALHEFTRYAVGWVEEYGHPAASDATEGRTVAKQTAFRAAAPPKQFGSD